MRLALTLHICLLLPGLLSAQSGFEITGPKHELRAVWLTTAHGLDFPTTDPVLQQLMEEERRARDWPATPFAEPEDQREELIDILEQAYELGLNAIVFQVMPRGDVFYESERLPWSHLLTGEPGQDPGWDPLQTVIETSQEMGMEVHAWMNFGRVGGDGQPMPEQAPFHIYQDHEEWIEQVDDDWWLNPGIPAARDWVGDNVMELVRNYDIDAIHFDFIRYPTGGFESDPESMEQYNPDQIEELDDWRRDNINRFMKQIYPRVKSEKPWVKVGSTPVGHYRQGDVDWPALWGYDSVFQDSRRWLREEVNDYLAPQVYWSIGGEPDFEILARGWVDHSYDRHIYLGKAPYLDDVRAEIDRQIDLGRDLEADGSVYFRFRHITRTFYQDSPLDSRYQTHRSLIPPMDWKETESPAQPADLAGGWSQDEETVELSWEGVSFETGAGDTLVRYAIYRAEGEVAPAGEQVIQDAGNLVGLTGSNGYRHRPASADVDMHYYVTALNRNSGESPPSEPLGVPAREDAGEPVVEEWELHQNYPNPFRRDTTIPFDIREEARVELQVFDVTGRRVARLEDRVYPQGRQSVTFDSGQLASGVYFYRIQITDPQNGRSLHTDDRPMLLIRP